MPDLTARLGSARTSILSLDLSGLSQSVVGQTIPLGGVVAKLTAGAAAALNHAFGTSAFKGGLVVRRATVRATVRGRDLRWTALGPRSAQAPSAARPLPLTRRPGERRS
jgi:hypothetical protein